VFGSMHFFFRRCVVLHRVRQHCWESCQQGQCGQKCQGGLSGHVCCCVSRLFCCVCFVVDEKEEEEEEEEEEGIYLFLISLHTVIYRQKFVRARFSEKKTCLYVCMFVCLYVCTCMYV
jgi:hypothetical protein